MLGSTHLILCRQMEHYTFPAIPINIYHRNIIYKYTYKLFPKRSLHTDTNISPECHHLHQIDHVWLETLCPQMQLDALPSQPKSGNFGQGCKFKSGRLYFHKFKCKLFILHLWVFIPYYNLWYLFSALWRENNKKELFEKIFSFAEKLTA
jgi:hypothetical protein